jgi:hypothetical protein
MQLSDRNPFVYGGPVDVGGFIGRQHEVKVLFEQVTNRVRGSVAVIGERRIGKTSLLHYIAAPDVLRRWNLDEQSSIFLFVDCGAIAPMTTTRFWQDILRRLRRELERRRRFDRLVSKVTELIGQTDIRTTDIEFLLEDLCDEQLLLVMLLDEFEWVVRTDPDGEAATRELLGGIRALINHASRALSVIVATRRPLDEICRDLRFMGSPFYNNFVYLHLRPFSRQEADSLLDQMLKNTPVVFSPAARTLIDELAGTHPLLLQAAAACVFDALEDAGPAPIDRRLVLERFMDQTDHQWQDLWRWSTQGEQEVLMKLAKHVTGGRSLLEAKPQECRSLVKRGLIVADSEAYRLFSPTLRHWLLELAAGHGRMTASGHHAGTRAAASMVFVSYSHKDDAEKDALLTHLRVLRDGADLVEVWSDEEIGGGEAWEAAIEKAISRARVAILLVTANFLSSNFILKKEVPALLKRREHEGVTVLPVIAKACAWKKIAWLAKMNVRPKNGIAIWGAAKGQPDDALAAVTEEIASILDDGADPRG